MKIAIIGFGEAGGMFGRNLAGKAEVHAYDIKQGDAMRQKAKDCGVIFQDDLAACLSGADLVMSLVTADSAPDVAKNAQPMIAPGQVFLEMNSVAPKTKQDNAKLIPSLTDIAIMAPVFPQEAGVPLLVAGPDADEISSKLNDLGLNAKVAGGEIGRAAAIKMCRSVMIKGFEALTVESMRAARFYGVEDEVQKSLHASFPQMGWDKDRADYWFERVATHGRRRAAEMREVAKTVSDTGVTSKMALTTSEAMDIMIDALDAAGIDYDPDKMDWTALADRLQR